MIRKEIDLPASRDEVWEALTDPERLADWFANEAAVELRPGGRIGFRWGNGEERHATLTEVEPEERLAFTWDDEGDVEFTLEDADGGTRLTVIETTPAWTTALDLQASAFAAAPAVRTFLSGRREPSSPRTQGAHVSVDTGATEDEGMRRFAAVLADNVPCGRGRNV